MRISHPVDTSTAGSVQIAEQTGLLLLLLGLGFFAGKGRCSFALGECCGMILLCL